MAVLDLARNLDKKERKVVVYIELFCRPVNLHIEFIVVTYQRCY